MAQQKLDDKPGYKYDSEEESKKVPPVPPDDGLEEAWKKSDDVDGGIAEAEKYANSGDGNDTATSPKENNITNNWKNNSGKGNKKSGSSLLGKKAKFAIVSFIAVIAISIGGAIILLPGLAVKTVVTKSTEFFMDRVSYATEKRVEKYVSGYITKYVGGSIDRCGTFISADCRAIDPGKGIAGNLYKSWSESRLEERLFRDYGLEFTKETRGGKTDIIVYKTNAAGIRGEVGVFGENTVTREVSQLIDNDTRWRQVRDRLGVRSLLAGKFDANKWCFIACDKQDSLDDIRINALTRAKLRIAARITAPINAKQTAIIICLISDCTDTETNAGIRNAAREAAGATDLELDEAYRAISSPDIGRNLSVGQYYKSKLIEKILIRFGVQNATRAAFSAVPLAGQIYAGITLADLYDRLDEKLENRELSKYIQGVNESAYVEYFSIMQASSDAVFSGEASLEDTGAMSTILSGSNKSRVFQKASGSGDLSTVECADGVVLSGPNDPLACPEKSVRPTIGIEEWRNSGPVQAFQPIINTYGNCIGGTDSIIGLCPQGEPKKYIRPILNGINWAAEGLVSIGLSAIGAIPIAGDVITNLVERAQEFVAERAGELIGWISEKAFKNVINPDAEGQEAFDQLAAGMDVSANSYARGDITESGEQIGLGGTKLTEQQEVALAEAIKEEKAIQRSEQSFFARYFDTNNADSLVANAGLKIAQAVYDFKDEGYTLPTQAIASLASNLIPSPRTNASGLTNRGEIFNVQQYGYAVDDPNLEIPLEELTPERCQLLQQERENTATIDPETNEKVYTVSNPCLMDEQLEVYLTKLQNLDPESSRFSGVGTSTTTLDSPGLNGYAIPCEGLPRTVVRAFDGANWDGIPDSGVIGINSAGQEIKVYVREACDQSNVRTLVIGSSIHGSENGGQIISQELLFNEALPPDVRVIAIPEINKWGVPTSTRKNANGVDLNRNYDYLWDTLTETKNLSPSGKNYKGTAAESEPETKAVANFLRSLGRTSLFISYHDNINWVAPVGSTPLSIAQSYGSNTGMSIGNAGGLYVTQRGSMDAWYNAETGSPSLLVELTNDRSENYINVHVNAVKELFENNVVSQ